MKIAIVCTGSPETLGGETMVAIEQAKTMAKHDEIVLIAGSKEKATAEDKVDGYRRLLLSGATNDSHFVVPNLSVKNTRAIFEFLDDFSPDIIHAHSLFGTSNIAQVWAKMHDVPFFYTTHEIPSRLAEWLDAGDNYIFSAFMGSPIPKSYFLSFYDNCDGVIALNEVSRRDIIEYGYRGDLYVVPNGRELGKFSNLKIPDVTQKEKKLLFVGTIGGRKNQEFLIRAMEHLPSNYRLTLIGRFLPQSMEPKIRKMADKAGNVDVVGPVDPSTIPQILEQHHLVVSASKAEVQSLTVIESLASGTPVVGLSNETIDELISDAVGRALAKDASAKEFARIVKEIMEQPQDQYVEMTKQARARVAHLDWSTIANRLTKLYQLYTGEDYKPLPEKEVRGMMVELLDTLPDFKAKEYLLDRMKAWRRISRSGAERVKRIGKIPASTFAITGFTLVAFAAILGGLKVSNRLKKKSKEEAK